MRVGGVATVLMRAPRGFRRSSRRCRWGVCRSGQRPDCRCRREDSLDGAGSANRVTFDGQAPRGRVLQRRILSARRATRSTLSSATSTPTKCMRTTTAVPSNRMRVQERRSPCACVTAPAADAMVRSVVDAEALGHDKCREDIGGIVSVTRQRYQFVSRMCGRSSLGETVSTEARFTATPDEIWKQLMHQRDACPIR